jgi:hypothetical protein
MGLKVDPLVSKEIWKFLLNPWSSEEEYKKWWESFREWCTSLVLRGQDDDILYVCVILRMHSQNMMFVEFVVILFTHMRRVMKTQEFTEYLFKLCSSHGHMEMFSVDVLLGMVYRVDQDFDALEELIDWILDKLRKSVTDQKMIYKLLSFQLDIGGTLLDVYQTRKIRIYGKLFVYYLDTIGVSCFKRLFRLQCTVRSLSIIPTKGWSEYFDVIHKGFKSLDDDLTVFNDTFCASVSAQVCYSENERVIRYLMENKLMSFERVRFTKVSIRVLCILMSYEYHNRLLQREKCVLHECVLNTFKLIRVVYSTQHRLLSLIWKDHYQTPTYFPEAKKLILLYAFDYTERWNSRSWKKKQRLTN